MHPSPAPSRPALIALLLVAALLAVAGCSKDGEGDSKGPKNGVWEKGTAWKVDVTQDAGKVTPGGDGDMVELTYRFRVAGGAGSKERPWRVHVTQEGAEGPFAAGWDLFYVDDPKGVRLSQVAFGEQEPVEPKLASIVLGLGFPLEARYTAPPKDANVDGAKLLDDASGAPEGALPPAAPNEGSIPKDQPKIDSTGAPAG